MARGRATGADVRGLSLAGFVAAVAFVAAGCGGGDDGDAAADPPPTTTTTVADTTTTTENPWTPEEQEVIDAHEAAMDASLEAAEGPKPDPDYVALAETHTGDRLKQESTTIEAMVLNGTAFRFPDDKVHKVTYESVTFDEAYGVEIAYLEVCTVTNLEEYVVETDVVLSRSGLRTTTATLTFHRVDGQWKVAETEHHDTQEGEAECVFD